MIVGYHIVIGAYGFWLPNDPRGSWSDFVGSWNLFRYGPATLTDETRSVAGVQRDRALRLAAKQELKHPPVELTGIQARAIGSAFAEYVEKRGLVVWACAILPDHMHLVVGELNMTAEQLVVQLKGQATQRLLAEGLHPFGHLLDKNGRPAKCFARGQWIVFLDPEDVPRAIQYVENNPGKEGKKRQRWSFITPYFG